VLSSALDVVSAVHACAEPRVVGPCPGIVAILFCGVVMAHYTYHNLSPQAQKFSTKLFKVMASLSEMFVFAYLGLALFSFDQVYDIGLIFFSVVRTQASPRRK
jgi:NhaP-type Na+/H+ or K+/H+ antiporter